MAIVLASASPRRKELMERFCGQELIVLPAKGEEAIPEGAGPGKTVEALARGKAREVAALRRTEPAGSSEDVVIGADTIVWHEGRIFGKPHSREEAAAMLRSDLPGLRPRQTARPTTRFPAVRVWVQSVSADR